MMKRGFTLIELLVVIAIIAILASILFPVFGRAREKARQTKCTSNLKQLATQLQIYSQENNGRYPGSDWVYAFADVSPKVFCCPSSNGTEGTDISYGYNGLLIRTDEPAQAPKGLAEAQIKAPTEVGAFADCTPINSYQNVLGACTAGAGACNLIGGGGLKGSAATVSLYPVHAGGIIASFCDGHAKYFKGSDLDEKNPANSMTRAFTTATQVGILDNSGGGLETALGVVPPGSITIGGDYAARPLLEAIGASFTNAAPTTPTVDRGFKGAFNADGKRGVYAWADGSNTALAPQATLAQDAMVIIVAKGSTLETGSAPAMAAITPIAGSARASITMAGAAAIFQAGVDSTTAPTIQAYTYDSSSGSREFFYTAIAKAGTWNSDLGNSTIVGNDLEMVDKVSTDPKGIGYCSAAFADPNVVDILGYGNPGAAKYFPNGSQNASAANQWRWPADPSSYDPTLVRTLYADCDSAATATLITNAYTALKASTCPFFKAGYF